MVWGTPRYAILRVYRGLVDDLADEPGWQHYKPSAVPAGDQARVQAACATLADLRVFQEIAKECEEGGDLGSAIAVARSATIWAPTEPAAWVFLADYLVRGAGSVVSVLEKGDFFSAARQALQRALELEPRYIPAHLALGRFLVMTAYRNGDLKRAIADLDHALRLDPKFLPAYIDRGIISYRQRKFGRAYADLARPRRPEKATHSRSAPAKRPRIAQAGVPTWMAWSQAQTAMQDPSHGDGFTSAMH